MSVALAIEPAVAASLPESPYIGLVPYDEADAAFFFGRSTEAAIVAANLRSAPLTILYGPSGVGKSSLLMAGAVHRLHEDARAADDENRFAVCVYRSWRDEPVRGLQEAARVALQELAGDEPLPPPAATLAETLRAWTGQTARLLLVFDQFEEYFQYHSDESEEQGLTGFAAELARIVNDPTLGVHGLLSIREDAWAKLDRFKGRIPSLFSNYLRVDHLDLDAAREAIEEPIAAWNRSLPADSEPYAIEPALTDAVLQAAAGGGLTLTAGSENAAVHEASGDRVEAPFLQLVLERLWRETVAAGEHTLTLARLEALGGARRIVENHLLDALARLSQPEQDIASDCFRFLVSRSETKIAHPAADLAEWTQRPEPQVTAVLDKLGSGESGRILRAVAPAQNEGSTSYELFHDILAEPIVAWRRNHEAERSRRVARRRVIRVGSILVALVAVFGALCIWALVQRSDAREATTSATSLALASAANDQLGTRVDESLLLSLEAFKSRPTVQAKSSMISALETARQLAGNASLDGHADAVRSVAFSPDGTTLVSGGDDWTVRLWDVHTHKQLGQPLRGNAAAVSSVAFGPDGTTLASAGYDKTVRLWNVRTHKQIGRPLRGHAGIVWGVAFSPDGSVLASAHDDGTVRLWDIRTHGELGQLRGHTGRVEGVAFSPDGTMLASAGDDKTVRLWSVRKQKQLGRPLLGNTSSVWGVAFSPDGTMLASVGYDKTVRLWSVRKHEQLGRPLQGHTGPVEGVAFSPNGTTLASASYDKTVRLWDVRTHKEIGEPRRGHTGVVFGVAFNPDGTTLASASDDDTVRLWDLRPHPPLGFPLRGHTKYVQGVAFSPDGTMLASAGADEAVRLWNVDTLKPIGKPLLGHTGVVYGVDFSPDGTTLASGSWDGTVRLWNARTHKPIGQPLVDRSGAVSGVAFSPDGATLASTGGTTVRLWNVHTHKELGQPLRGHTDSVSGVAFSPDGTMLASASWDGTVRLWDVSTHKQLGQPLDERGVNVYSVAFNPDGTMLATASADTTVRLWDVRSHNQIGRPFRGHTDEVGGVAFGPDGTMLASGGTDGTVRLWDVKTHTELGPPLLGHANSVYAVAFNPAGTMLASGGQDTTVRLWNGMLWRDFDDLKTRVCSLVGGNLTRAEWEDLAPGISYHRICPS